jgi:hypothetical protein
MGLTKQEQELVDRILSMIQETKELHVRMKDLTRALANSGAKINELSIRIKELECDISV